MVVRYLTTRIIYKTQLSNELIEILIYIIHSCERLNLTSYSW